MFQVEVSQILRKRHQRRARLLRLLHHFFHLTCGALIVLVHKRLFEKLLIIWVRAKETKNIEAKIFQWFSGFAVHLSDGASDSLQLVRQ